MALGGAHALVAPPRLDTPSLLLLAVAGLLLLLPGGFPGRRMAGLLALPLLFAPPRLPRDDLLRLHVLDVGQGLAVVVETRRHVLLYDTGASFSPDASIGDRIVLPVLESLGIDKIDTLVLSHNDDDHSGGFAAIDAAMPIGRLYSSFGAVSSTGMAHACRDRIAWRWDGVAFRFLHPAAPVENDNDNSCVLQIRAGDFGALLPGDIEATVERELAGALGEELRGDVLIAAHHGSNTSSSWPFLKMVDPEHVVFAAGYRNAFGHPSPAVLERAAGLHPQPAQHQRTRHDPFHPPRRGRTTASGKFPHQTPPLLARPTATVIPHSAPRGMTEGWRRCFSPSFCAQSQNLGGAGGNVREILRLRFAPRRMTKRLWWNPALRERGTPP